MFDGRGRVSSSGSGGWGLGIEVDGQLQGFGFRVSGIGLWGWGFGLNQGRPGLVSLGRGQSIGCRLQSRIRAHAVGDVRAEVKDVPSPRWGLGVGS